MVRHSRNVKSLSCSIESRQPCVSMLALHESCLIPVLSTEHRCFPACCFPAIVCKLLEPCNDWAAWYMAETSQCSLTGLCLHVVAGLPANDGSVILHNPAAIDFWCLLMQVFNLHICCLHCQTASQACSLDFCCLHLHQAPNGCGCQ